MIDRHPVRIWYQSFVDEIEQAPYFERLRARLNTYAAQQTRVDVHGMSPPDRYFHPITEFRCAAQAIRNAVRAKEAGYDAYVIGHFQEPGLVECRGAVDIPVIGLGEATLLFGCSVGRKLGLVTIDPVFIPYHEAQVAGHGLRERVAGIAAIKADLSRFMAAFADSTMADSVRQDFSTQVAPLVAAGADVLIPAGGLPMLLFAEQQPFFVDEAYVLEGIVTVLKAAEAAVAVHRTTGVAAGRSGMFKLASRGAIDDLLRSDGSSAAT
jgi:allantoin racemase